MDPMQVASGPIRDHIRRKNIHFEAPAAERISAEVDAFIRWFLDCLDRALVRAEQSLAGILRKSAVWGRINAGMPVNDRQRCIVNALLDGAHPEISTSKYAKLARCSLDTALRDIKALVEADLLMPGAGGGRSTRYRLKT